MTVKKFIQILGIRYKESSNNDTTILATSGSILVKEFIDKEEWNNIYTKCRYTNVTTDTIDSIIGFKKSDKSLFNLNNPQYLTHLTTRNHCQPVNK